ncbi:E3 ubiquitin-protein ligase TRIM35-like [Onychostoma macrolepis]|uniref:E3 ubiquitin-protein ligase TRIM35-like n=1 Tax=Onychostoma macrolepis TaxID=369639 RepID=UPI002729DC9C|nr:E3 ubiquitin-protein ligase TRIM35-like [Onychostoma macrolepis]
MMLFFDPKVIINPTLLTTLKEGDCMSLFCHTDSLDKSGETKTTAVYAVRNSNSSVWWTNSIHSVQCAEIHRNMEITHSDTFVSNKEFDTTLKSLQEKIQLNENIKRNLEKTVQHIKSQAEHTERQIKQQFETLHQFLRDEEEATITELREEEEQKTQMLKEKLEEINRHISALSHTIKDTEEMMKAGDILKEFPVSMERVQNPQPDPQMPSGALIHVPRYLGNLPFRVWKKMEDIIQNTPVILDPNTTHQDLILSDDLTSVRVSRNNQPPPDNPERFNEYLCVLGSEGFDSGKHWWDVEVKGSSNWRLGITTISNQRKGRGFFNTDVWCVWHGWSLPCAFHVEQQIDRVRVYLDCDIGMVSFSDPVTNTHLHTFKAKFTQRLVPFFWCLDSLSILPIINQNPVLEHKLEHPRHIPSRCPIR